MLSIPLLSGWHASSRLWVWARRHRSAPRPLLLGQPHAGHAANGGATPHARSETRAPRVRAREKRDYPISTTFAFPNIGLGEIRFSRKAPTGLVTFFEYVRLKFKA